MKESHRVDFRCAPTAVAVQAADRRLTVRMAQAKFRTLAVAGLLAVVLLAAGTQVSSGQEKKDLRGLPNFGQVTGNLYRGGQPTSDGFKALQTMGVGIVVDLREESSEIAAEKRQVESLGMKSVGIPWSANHDPSDAQIVEFLDLVRANPDAKIFVHCRRGADRTGVMVAAYRVAVEHKPVADAISEMRRYHYDWLFLPHLRRYIESLPGLLQSGPQFLNYRPQLSGSK